MTQNGTERLSGAPFAVGDIVETIKGAKFWGEVVSVYPIKREAQIVSGNASGTVLGLETEWRADVRAIAADFLGTIHVYPTVQLAPRSHREAETGVADCAGENHSHQAHDWRTACLKCGAFKGSDLFASPQRETEGPFAWHWQAKNNVETWPVWVKGAERPKHAPETAIPLYTAPLETEGREITEEEIERAAKAIYIAQNGEDDWVFHENDGLVRAEYIKMARAALAGGQ